VTRLKKGDRVAGAMGGLGAYAEVVAVNQENLAVVPDALGLVEASALPIASVAAWQSLNYAGSIRAGQRILIHGAAGGLGGFAVQFAKQLGAEVFATARGHHADYVRDLGADHVIDFEKDEFETIARDIDLVLDYVGGKVLARSWDVLAKDGAIVSTASPDILASTPAGKRGLWFVNKPDADKLQHITNDVVSGKLKSKIDIVVSLDGLADAIERNRTQTHLGKTVVDFSK
jgi:NADPH:quinone reductase-like Zn-dependent oxidoreductase